MLVLLVCGESWNGCRREVEGAALAVAELVAELVLVVVVMLVVLVVVLVTALVLEKWSWWGCVARLPAPFLQQQHHCPAHQQLAGTSDHAPPTRLQHRTQHRS